MDGPLSGVPRAGLSVASDVTLEVLGVRHHGPGSARSVAAALDEVRPTAVLIEGAPELDAVAALAGDDRMVPPIAGLVYVLDQPRSALFYPLADFSPEWVALRWALRHDVAVRFADLPGANLLAPAPEPALDIGGDADVDVDGDSDGDAAGDADARSAPAGPEGPPVVRPDAIATLAGLAGYDDPERWWEDAVEQRAPGSSVLDRFRAVRAAMAAVRESERADGRPAGWWDENERREAAMRKAIREVVAAGHERIAFVCGAYHAPALVLDAHPPAAQDNRTLKGLTRVKVGATWAPWTSGRLAASSGYGAGVSSPGWYRHLFVTADDVVSRWMVAVAGALRDEQMDASTASVVEATRLAESLAVIRRRPSVGLAELTDATRAVLCDGSDVPLALIHRRLVVGEDLGSVPDATPMVPLAADLARHQRSLRLKPSAVEAVVTVDLRKDSQLARSVLFHRLLALGVDWAVPTETGRTLGTFKEAWRTEWRPELTVALIEAGVHGTTIASAAASKVGADAAAATDLATLATLVETCLLAELPDALARVVRALEEQTAQQHDVLALLGAAEPIARTCRYGDVRGTDVTALLVVLETIVTRASIGLRPACAALDDSAAVAMRAAIESANSGVLLIDRPELGRPWSAALVAVAEQDGVHGSVSGRVNRFLLDAGRLDREEAARRLSRRLSVAADASAGAAWLDGFLAGDAVLLLYDDALLATIDEWVAGIGDEVFDDLLPLLRRTFARYERAERRAIGEQLREGGDGDRSRVRTGREPIVDLERAGPAVRTVAALLGWEAGP